MKVINPAIEIPVYCEVQRSVDRHAVKKGDGSGSGVCKFNISKNTVTIHCLG